MITTKRAYEELEREGFIVSYTGKGSFVASQNMELIKEQKYREIEDYLRKASDTALTCDVSLEEILQMLEMIYKGEA